MRRTKPFLFAFALGLASMAAQAGQVETIVFNLPPPGTPPAPTSGGSGTLSGGNVNYATMAVLGPGGSGNDIAGNTVALQWGGIPGTIVPGETPGANTTLPLGTVGTSSTTGGVLGETTSSVELISFSQPILNPILLLSKTDPLASYNLGSLVNYAGKLVLLNSSNSSGPGGSQGPGPGALLTGTTLTFPNTANNTFDAAAVQFLGSYTQLVFFASTTNPFGADTQTFTITPAGVPEPSTFAAAGAMTLAGLAYQWRRRKSAVASA